MDQSPFSPPQTPFSPPQTPRAPPPALREYDSGTPEVQWYRAHMALPSTSMSYKSSSNDSTKTLVPASRRITTDAAIDVVEPPPPAYYPPPREASWDTNYPSTWPVVYLPYHKNKDKSVSSSALPTALAEMLVHVHYKGPAAQKLQELLLAEINAMQTNDEKDKVEALAFLCWPCNIGYNSLGRFYWKHKSGMTEREVEQWRNWRLNEGLVKRIGPTESSN